MFPSTGDVFIDVVCWFLRVERISDCNLGKQDQPRLEAIIDWSMQKAHTGKLGNIDPALLAKWWREFEPTVQFLEPSLLEEEKLNPLLSTAPRPLIHLQPTELDTVEKTENTQTDE